MSGHCSDPGCVRPAVVRGMCKTCYKRACRAGTLRRVYPTKAQSAALIEDAIWLLDNRESPERVAQRLGTTVAALEIQCRRSGQPRRDLMAAVGRQRRAS